jgi:hypothetical protein
MTVILASIAGFIRLVPSELDALALLPLWLVSGRTVAA